MKGVRGGADILLRFDPPRRYLSLFNQSPLPAFGTKPGLFLPFSPRFGINPGPFSPRFSRSATDGLFRSIATKGGPRKVWRKHSQSEAGSNSAAPVLSAKPDRDSSPAPPTSRVSDSEPGAVKSMWVPKATLTTSPEKRSPSQAAVVEETAYPVKKGVLKVKSEVRATFYPKFENEKSDQEIRSRMIEVVSAGRGVVEVTLKHSGSLFMYAGDGDAFAKNSFGNLYTAVGVYVLGKTLEQAWGSQYREKQREFNAYLKNNRISISMELVTAVLGDHGQRPLKDYVVVTAVTELSGRPRFYSTPDLVEFCRQWRLPTNEVWLFSTRKSSSACFAAYDALCEQSIYSVVRDSFNKIADTYVPGTESHGVVQGEILEGLVARIVSFESVEKLKRVAEKYPVPDHLPGSYTAPGLREICSENRQSEKEQSKALLKAVGTDFCSDWSAWFQKDKDQTSQSTWFSKFVSTPAADEPTAKLQEMIRLLKQKKMPVKFKCQGHSGVDNEFTMTIHVLQDSVFRRYQKEMQYNPSLWPLYRGFFVDVKLTKDPLDTMAKKDTEPHLGHLDEDAIADDAEHLMVKLKFLTYKIRTFLIRNGLDILFNRGHHAYKEYYLRQMKIWGTSPEKQRELSKLLDEWAVHITRKIKTGKLREGSYLSEAEPFLKEFASRGLKNQLLVGQAGTDIDTDAYIAATRGDEEDEEGDLKQDIGSSTDIPITKTQGIKAKGLLVFFPGIPGCAKSALCNEILNTPGGLGDSRPMKSLMGDLIKARYWAKVTEDRLKNPNVITLADKNAPNEEVWRMVTDISKQTDAIAIPVVPDSEGTESNPFSLDSLSVFIFRVLHREKHPGNLDKNSPYPGYVLLMFYNLYEGKDRNDFETSLHERYGYLVKVPLLKPNRPPLPQPIKAVLEEGLDLFQKHSAKHGKADPSKGAYKKQFDEWEAKLKNVLFSHSSYLNDIQVPFEEAVKSVREQLRAVVTGQVQVHMPEPQERKLHSFNYAALTVPLDGIHEALSKASKCNPEVEAFLKPKNLQGSLRGGHVTLAHVRSHGVAAVAEYGAYVGEKVPCKFTALLYCPRMAALEAHIMSDSISSKNQFAHVTLWTAKGTPPKEAGSLASLVEKGEATRVELPEPVVITGKVEFKL